MIKILCSFQPISWLSWFKFELKTEWHVKLSSAALKRVLALPPRYFSSDKSASKSTESVRRASLTRSKFKNWWRTSSHAEPRAAAAQLRIRMGPSNFEISNIERCCQKWDSAVASVGVPMRMGKWNNGRLGPHPARDSDTTLATLWIQFFN